MSDKQDLRRRALFSTDTDKMFGKRKFTTFNLSDYNWTNAIHANIKTNVKIPYLLISEFQPDLLYNYGDVVDKGIGALGKFISGVTARGKENEKKKTDKEKPKVDGQQEDTIDRSASARELSGALGDAGSAAVIAGVRKLSESRMASLLNELSDFTEFNTQVMTNPVNYYKNILSGIVVANYQTPFTDDHAVSVQNNAWASGTNEDALGQTISQLIRNNMPITVPGVPTWDDSAQPEFANVSYKFELINNNADNLTKNIVFMRSFISGAFWLQANFFKKSSNLYHIWFPGQFRYYFCCMSVTVESVGRRRIPPKHITSALFNADSVDVFIPDAYSIKVEFKSLVPNNYNMYLDSIMGNNSMQSDIKMSKAPSDLDDKRGNSDTPIRTSTGVAQAGSAFARLTVTGGYEGAADMLGGAVNYFNNN